jgi:hypothetical protein
VFFQPCSCFTVASLRVAWTGAFPTPPYMLVSTG